MAVIEIKTEADGSTSQTIYQPQSVPEHLKDLTAEEKARLDGMIGATSEAGPSHRAASATGAAVLELLGSADELIVEERAIEVKGQPMTFYIKRLSRRELDRILSKRQRRSRSGRVEPVEDGDITVLAHLLVECVRSDKTGNSPLWSWEQVVGKSPKMNKGEVIEAGYGGLLDNPNQAAEELITDLELSVYEVNPSLNPILTAQAMASLGLT